MDRRKRGLVGRMVNLQALPGDAAGLGVGVSIDPPAGDCQDIRM
jgi:hypothetical protein